jgi:amidohydrolase
MGLHPAELEALVALRHELHRHPELSGEEAGTASRIREHLAALGPDTLLDGIGGHGIAAVFTGSLPGPTVLFRCELDGLPIEECGRPAYRSTVVGLSHMCGHDGHMAIVTALAHLFRRRPPARGRAVLLYQPAEETGAGAAAVLADERFRALAPDYCFALHNMPGLPLGEVALRAGPVSCASRGMRIELTGSTAHASQPETGLSPAAALAQLLAQLPALGGGRPTDAAFAMATVTHAQLGEPSFGVAPGRAALWLTLRTGVDEAMERLVSRAEAMARTAAEAAGLSLAIGYEDVFHHCDNDEEATAILRAAMAATGTPEAAYPFPMRASEDFGLFGASARAALCLLGAGEQVPHLHNADYDFPDPLIETGADLFAAVAEALLGASGP